MRATAVAKSGYTPVATAAQIAAPRLAPPGPLAREAGIPKTSAKICMKSGLDEPPPEITTSRSDEVRARMLGQYFSARGTTAEALASLMKSEREHWAKVIKAAGVQPE